MSAFADEVAAVVEARRRWTGREPETGNEALRLTERGVTPEFYARLAALAAHAEQAGAYVALCEIARPGDLEAMQGWVHAAEAALLHTRVRPEVVLGWMAVLASDRDRVRASGLWVDLAGCVFEWAAVGILGPLLWAAGQESMSREALDVEGLRVLAALRGFVLPAKQFPDLRR